MDVLANDILLRDFEWVQEDTQTPEAKRSRHDRDDLARDHWQAEAGFKNALLVTVIMAPFRIWDFSESFYSMKVLPLFLWYATLLAYIVRGWLVSSGCTKARKLLGAVYVGSPDDETNKTWLCVLQVVWACSGQFLYFHQAAFTMGAPALMLLGVHVPKQALYTILLPLNMAVLFCYQWTHSDFSCVVIVAQCLLQAAAVTLIVSTREVVEKEHFHGRLASERGRFEALRTRLWAEAQRATFRGMLDSVFDASCLCGQHGIISSSTPQLDAILFGGRAPSGGVVGKCLVDFAADGEEEARLTTFLKNVSQTTGARRIHTSLRRPGDERAAPVEVTISGISVPPGEENKADSVAAVGTADAACNELFIGLEVAPGAATLEPPEEAVEVDAVVPPALGYGQQDTAESGSTVDSISALGDEKCHVAARSLASAPPIMECLGMTAADIHDVNDFTCESGDCLPAGTMVRVEGKAAPVRVESVALGQRVLCVDHLSGSLKYADVVEAETSDEAAPDLVEVELEDGTQVQMTADHPVFVGSDQHLRAGDLRVGQHRLEVLKVMSVPVKAVRQVPQESPCVAIVSLSVHQPQRHSLFVSPPGADPTWQHGVAVASASMASPEERLPLGFRLKNTFIDLAEEPGTPVRRRCRASSAPGRWSSTEESMTSRSPKRRSSSRPQSTSSRRSSTLGSAATSSKVSTRSSDGESVVIVLSKTAEDRRVRGWSTANCAKLSDVLHAKRIGLKSFGSVGHEEGWCYPCLMQSWGNPERPCIFGLACSRCHECHSKRQFKKARYFRPRADRIPELAGAPMRVGRVGIAGGA